MIIDYMDHFHGYIHFLLQFSTNYLSFHGAGWILTKISLNFSWRAKCCSFFLPTTTLNPQRNLKSASHLTIFFLIWPPFSPLNTIICGLNACSHMLSPSLHPLHTVLVKLGSIFNHYVMKWLNLISLNPSWPVKFCHFPTISFYQHKCLSYHIK